MRKGREGEGKGIERQEREADERENKDAGEERRRSGDRVGGGEVL